jgi:hypothetical protein
LPNEAYDVGFARARDFGTSWLRFGFDRNLWLDGLFRGGSMKNLLILFLFGLALFGLNSCASTGITTSGSGEAVPGEKVGGMEDRVGAGVTGSTPTAQVKW